jgi:metal-responsive CopG/Arc/MetJ family transcriptional regulator
MIRFGIPLLKVSELWHYGCMASRKMTFSLPDDLARRFSRRVPARERSSYVSQAIEARLRGQEERWARACEAANADLDVSAIEREWDSIVDEIAEPWADAETR